MPSKFKSSSISSILILYLPFIYSTPFFIFVFDFFFDLDLDFDLELLLDSESFFTSADFGLPRFFFPFSFFGLFFEDNFLEPFFEVLDSNRGSLSLLCDSDISSSSEFFSSFFDIFLKGNFD